MNDTINDKQSTEDGGAVGKTAVRRGFFSSMAYSHRFFVNESPYYMTGTKRAEYYIGYPRAYIRFMWYSFRDYVLYWVHNRA
jgi:hypothetical protein